jgi:quinol monooxygenase YgiN
MVLEIAQITAQAGKAEALKAGLLAAIPVIRSAEGCHSATVRQQIEDSSQFVLQIEWETLEHHTVTFRGGPLFAEYRSHINDLFVDPIVARHYQQVDA